MEQKPRLFARRYAPAKTDAPPAPDKGAARYFFLLGTHFWKFVGLSLLGTALSLPVVTAPATLSAVNRVCVKLVREGNCFLWSDFWEEWKGSFWKSLPLGLLFGCGLFSGFYFLNLGIINAQSAYGVPFAALGFLLAAVSGTLGAYAFVLCAMVSLPVRAILRNAACLAALAWKRSLCVLLLLVFLLLFTLLLLPLSIVLDVLLLFGVLQYTLCFIIHAPIEERVVAPYEAAQTDREEIAE